MDEAQRHLHLEDSNSSYLDPLFFSSLNLFFSVIGHVFASRSCLAVQNGTGASAMLIRLIDILRIM